MRRLAAICRWLAGWWLARADWVEPQAGAQVAASQADTMTLVLHDARGLVKHEIALHGCATAPVAYVYGGVRYRRARAVSLRMWEYQPYAR